MVWSRERDHFRGATKMVSHKEWRGDVPNRIIKESICSSGSLDGLSDFEENFFYKLIVNCDDYGRFDARPSILKARCYPLRDSLRLNLIEDALLQLERAGCVEVYTVDGKPYLRLPSWELHQQIRAKKSKYPAPDGFGLPTRQSDSNGNQLISDDSICPRNPIQSESKTKNTSRAREDCEPDYPPLFLRFWELYPKRKSKGAALKAWKKINPSRELCEKIGDALKRLKASREWAADGGKYIPNPATWLNAAGWEDEVAAEASPQAPYSGYRDLTGFRSEDYVFDDGR